MQTKRVLFPPPLVIWHHLIAPLWTILGSEDQRWVQSFRHWKPDENDGHIALNLQSRTKSKQFVCSTHRFSQLVNHLWFISCPDEARPLHPVPLHVQVVHNLYSQHRNWTNCFDNWKWKLWTTSIAPVTTMSATTPSSPPSMSHFTTTLRMWSFTASQFLIDLPSCRQIR